MINDDYKYCEAVIKAHSTSFYRAFRYLEEKSAKAVYAVYAFCRTADDLVDSGGSYEGFFAFEKEFYAFKNGKAPDKPLWRALKDVFVNFNMCITPFEEMLKGQKQDISFQRIKTLEKLDEYCYLVAGTVGLMLLPIISEHNDEKEREIAVKLGCAMQYTNILRDVGEDFLRGRIYLPQSLMDSFDYTDEDIKNGVGDKRYRALWESMAHIAESNYDFAVENIELFKEDARFPLLLAIEYYRAILSKVRKMGYIIYARAFLNKTERMVIFSEARRKLKVL